MRCSFVHFGDVHLGTLQYDSPERLDDFGRAWIFACQYIARRRPDFAVCTGDLFNRFAINPVTFDQAYAGLAMLRDVGVPIVDVHGNHDRPRYGEPKSWVQTLADQKLLTFLDVDSSGDGLVLRPVPAGGHQGSFVEWGGCRIFGLRYLGASTERILGQLETALQPFRSDGAFTILVLHAGLEGIVPNMNAELTAAALERMGGVVDYVALGHIHKHYAIGTFAYNGGSLETWSAAEWGWPRGLLEVEIDTDRSPAVATRLIDVPRRPFHVIRIDVEQFESPRALHAHCWERCLREQASRGEQRPVVILRLHGRLRFDESDVQVNKLEDACRSLLDPLVVRVASDFDTRDFVTEGAVDDDQEVDRAFLERAILQARISQDERYAPRARELAIVAGELKERALREDDGATLLAALRSGLARTNHDGSSDGGGAADMSVRVETAR